MNCTECSETTDNLTSVVGASDHEEWCEFCISTSTESCGVCAAPVDRFVAYEIAKGAEETVFVCPNCVLFWALAVRCDRIMAPLKEALGI